MTIEHVAIWVKDLEVMRNFYVKYFDMASNEKYINQKKGFSSYFLAFKDGARLELMYRKDILENDLSPSTTFGFTHIAISLGSQAEVDDLTKKLQMDGYVIAGEPRTTGDGYYESVILDPEGNSIELTV